jgi:hypothetical protein
MDSDLKHLLQELVSHLKQISSRDVAPSTDSVDLSQIKVNLSEIKNDLGWHTKIGGLAITAILFLFAWFFLKHPNDSREDALKQREQITADTTAAIQKAISPVTERLSVLTATIELLRPEAGKRLPAAMQENLHGDAALGLETVKALAIQARQKHIETNPGELVAVSSALPSSPEGFDTMLALLDYRSFLNTTPALRRVKVLPPLPIQPLPSPSGSTSTTIAVVNPEYPAHGYSMIQFMADGPVSDSELMNMPRAADLSPTGDKLRGGGFRILCGD